MTRRNAGRGVVSNLLFLVPRALFCAHGRGGLEDEMVLSGREAEVGEVKLPPLKVNILRAGEVVKVVEIQDPRDSLCRVLLEADPEIEAVPSN